MSIKLSLTRRAHILISANHRMERFSTKNDPLVIFDKTSKMTLSEEIRNSFRICLANESYFTINPLAAKDFLPYTFPWQGLFNPSAGFVIPKRGPVFPITGFSFPKWSSFNTRRDLSFAKWLERALIKANVYPLRRRSQNIAACQILSAPSALIFNFEASFETFHLAGLTYTSKAVAYWENTS